MNETNLSGELITVATFPVGGAAQVMASFLQSQGIPAFVQDEHTNSTLVGGSMIPVRLQVPIELVDDARALLEEGAEIDEDDDLPAAIEEVPDALHPEPSGHALRGIFVGAALGATAAAIAIAEGANPYSPKVLVVVGVPALVGLYLGMRR